MRTAILLTAAGVGAAAVAGVAATRPGGGSTDKGVVVVSGSTLSASAPSTSATTGAAGAGAVASTTGIAPAAATATSGWWKPSVSDTWQWQISGTINTGYDVDIYDVDLFDTPDATIRDLHGKGRRVICYFSAGSSEDWRPDYREFTDKDQGRSLDGWKGERWLDIRSDNVRRIMQARLDLAAQRGCDGVEPDNVDGYTNGNGLGLTARDQLDYNRFLADEAHKRGLAVGLKNNVEQADELVDAFDFTVNEQCHQYKECDTLRPFIAAGKPVFNAEYSNKYRDKGPRNDLCNAARDANIRTLVLSVKLNDDYRHSCDA